MNKEVVVLSGAGSIGIAIVRRISAGKHIVIADYSEKSLDSAKTILEQAGFEVSTLKFDLSSRQSIKELVEFATSKGEVKYVINAAGVSPSQAPVEKILQVDMYGTAVFMEEFGGVITKGGSCVIISSQSGHRLGTIPQEDSDLLATTDTESLLSLPIVRNITDTLKAYQYAKRCNVLKVMFEATRWAKRDATINSISPGIIITPLAADELKGPRGEGYHKMIESSPAMRAGTPDEVGDLAQFLMSDKGRFITGADFLIDGGTTASYFYGDLQYLKQTH
ncbi:MAG: SDR family oxidoreductase [Bacteroidales bacterium]|nr:SDR family oxidoreductase [Bacteroidales bacterium]